jgi:DNA-binding HxlR family transcriptional regulator
MKNHHGCPVQATINTVSGKWKVLAIWHLGFSPRRFAELRRLLLGVSEKVLTSQLRELEADGIVRRKVTRASPPQVTYSLTDAGEQLRPLRLR